MPLTPMMPMRSWSVTGGILVSPPHEHRARRTDDVQRPGDHDLAVVGCLEQRRRDGLVHGFRHFDLFVEEAQVTGRVGDPLGFEGSGRSAAGSRRADCDLGRSRRPAASRAGPFRGADRRRVCAVRSRTPRRGRRAALRRPATLCAPSSSTSGWRRTISSRPGETTLENAEATTSGSEWRTEKRFRGHERERGVVGLVPRRATAAAGPRTRAGV